MHTNIMKIRKKLKSSLDLRRFEHSLSVSYICIALAMRYGYNLEKAELAGLLHDCAKQYDDTVILNKCAKYNISITESEKMAPGILHAKLGAFMAMHKFHINDNDIVSAILSHTTGKPGMSLLEQIVFVADYIEPRRDKAPFLSKIRKIAFEDLDKATYLIMENTLNYLKCSQIPYDSMTERAFEYYRNKNIKRQE